MLVLKHGNHTVFREFRAESAKWDHMLRFSVSSSTRPDELYPVRDV